MVSCTNSNSSEASLQIMQKVVREKRIQHGMRNTFKHINGQSPEKMEN